MAMAIPIIMIAGAAISAMGAIQSAQAQENAANFNASINEQNARLALEHSKADAERFRNRALKAQGEFRAGLAASGAGLEGTESVLAESAANARLDEETILYKGRLQALGFHNSATLDRFRGETARQQGELEAASAIIGGFGKAGAQYSAARLRYAPSRGSSAGFYDF